ncbi:DEAD/DEAH box helicase [Candidatus Micrarchaeota archaeon]|nr:DEAD/DEAH box helicase [Candidatus Micrarchaeota archaeon]MBU1165491.1 DEAD/DEAH box helicase [Candidatus Micrarchaeota archaeon]MBU1886329.1 DEAD/DEAH box helicase [Candidatus Micrarchaeota archaeon]
MKFVELKLNEKTLRSISNHGYVEATEVQEKAIPKIIEGRNLIVRSQTGTGKTAAFGIGLIERIISKTSGKALVLAPTRELAIQVCKELRALSQVHQLKVHVVYGGQSISLQIRDLRGGCDILVATPGRLLDLCRRRVVDISRFNAIVLDEADHMLDLGFQEEVFGILDMLPKQRIILLFSATVDHSIKSIASKYMRDSELITLGEMEVVSSIKEEHIEITRKEKFSKFLEVIDSYKDTKILVFMKTKRSVGWLKDMLEKRGIRGMGMLHGDITQSRRNQVLTKFRENQLHILIATNVAARGLHIDDVGLIVNYDEAETEETHLHRVGRTGRMGAEGKVVNFVMRRESVHERMSENHDDFAWMKDGTRNNYSRRGGPRSGSSYGGRRSSDNRRPDSRRPDGRSSDNRRSDDRRSNDRRPDGRSSDSRRSDNRSYGQRSTNDRRPTGAGSRNPAKRRSSFRHRRD